MIIKKDFTDITITKAVNGIVIKENWEIGNAHDGTDYHDQSFICASRKEALETVAALLKKWGIGTP